MKKLTRFFRLILSDIGAGIRDAIVPILTGIAMLVGVSLACYLLGWLAIFLGFPPVGQQGDPESGIRILTGLICSWLGIVLFLIIRGIYLAVHYFVTKWNQA